MKPPTRYPIGKIVKPVRKEADNKVLFSESDLVDVSNHPKDNLISGRFIQTRINGDFTDKGFWLMSDTYDWTIVRDAEDELVLVPTRKQKR